MKRPWVVGYIPESKRVKPASLGLIPAFRPGNQGYDRPIMLATGFHSHHDLIAHALHGEGAGYYSGRIRTVGEGGDFSTAATLGGSLALAVARWAVAAAKETGVSHLIEIGGGDGSLASGILKALPWLSPLRQNYGIVDSSPSLREKQKGRLGKKVHWFDSMEEALAWSHGRALLVSNELVDAFPPDCLIWSDGEWRELGLEVLPDGGVRESSRAWAGTRWPMRARQPSAWPGGGPNKGQRIEHLGSFADWMEKWVTGWKAGASLWVDYGDIFPALYHRRPHGTLRAYHRHERLEGLDVFRRLGQQDITCDVNFSDLQAWGESMGLTTRRMETLGEFINRHNARRAGDPTDRPEVAGAFTVLEQRPFSKEERVRL